MKIENKNIVLHRANINDIETIINYRILFLKEIQGNHSNQTEIYLRQSLQKYLTKSILDESFISWIAELDGNPVGFSGMVIREQPGNFEIPNGKTGYILNMYTLPEHRKLGIGSFLFQKLLDEAKQRSLDKVELHATKDGEPIYRKYGFVEPHDKALEINVKSLVNN